MAKDINKYAQNIARARYASPSYTGPQRRATIDPKLFSGKGKTAAAGAPLASREVAAPIQETGPEAMSVEDGEATTKPQMITETQQPIENRGSSARYMIQGGGPRIDLSFLVPERANKAFDPSKAIGGENVPYLESKGVGGFFRRLLGDESNRMNIEAQQAQGAEWKAEAAEQKKEERLLNRMREADKPAALRFERQMEETRKENERRDAREAERLGLTKQQLDEARQDRLTRMQLERQQMLDRVTQDQVRNDILTKELELKSGAAGTPQMTGLPGGGLAVMDPRSGTISLVNPGTEGFKNIPGTPSTTRQVYPQVKVPAGGGGAQVDRATGTPMGGPLPADAGKPAAAVVTPPRMGAWPGVGEVKPDVTGLYYTAEPQGSSTLLKETGAFDIPESVTKEMTQYAMSPEQRMNILKRYQTGLRANRSGFPQFAE